MSGKATDPQAWMDYALDDLEVVRANCTSIPPVFLALRAFFEGTFPRLCRWRLPRASGAGERNCNCTPSSPPGPSPSPQRARGRRAERPTATAFETTDAHECRPISHEPEASRLRVLSLGRHGWAVGGSQSPSPIFWRGSVESKCRRRQQHRRGEVRAGRSFRWRLSSGAGERMRGVGEKAHSPSSRFNSS